MTENLPEDLDPELYDNPDGDEPLAEPAGDYQEAPNTQDPEAQDG